MKHRKTGYCAKCGTKANTQWHHIFGGAYRGRSESAGFVIELCPVCHRLMHDTDQGKKLKVAAEEKWFRDNPGKTLDDWIKLMGRSWL